MPEYTLLPKVQKGWSAAEAPVRVEVENEAARNTVNGKYKVKLGGETEERTIAPGTTANWLPHGASIAIQNTGTCALRIFWP